MFFKHNLNYSENLFARLASVSEFQVFSGGRQVANLFKTQEDGSIPIVRTTTPFTISSGHFLSIHDKIVNDIADKVEHPINFNNAMVEIYTSDYKRMGFHTDQALDLSPDSFIAIFSCYEDHLEEYPRKLIIKNKSTGHVEDIPMEHNSAIIFATSTNDQHVHKIVCGSDFDRTESRWLGITFRLSKTFVRYLDHIPYLLPDNIKLRLANEKESKELRKHKRIENHQVGYRYPKIDYSLSAVI